MEFPFDMSDFKVEKFILGELLEIGEEQIHNVVIFFKTLKTFGNPLKEEVKTEFSCKC